ncbi:MAG: hypothetical protein O2930_09285 [Acidobacteria bacterium]|nr:hypothetical protein [Acidobacteriota bacterium]
MGIRIAAFATAAVVTVGSVVIPVGAQRPEASPDLPMAAEDVVFELANSMGMLRGRSNADTRPQDSILTLEHWASGSLLVGDQRFDVPELRISFNFSYPGMREDSTLVDSTGARERRIQVVSGDFAWNETEPGMNATAAAGEVKTRLVRLWTSPFGIAKAAAMAGPLLEMERRDGQSAVLSFPLPDPVSDVAATVTVRKDASLVVPHPEAIPDLIGTYIVRVQTAGAVVSDTTYAEYGDQNWDDYRADIMLPKRIVRTEGNSTWTLTTVNTNTYNPYVVMPVPANVAQ